MQNSVWNRPHSESCILHSALWDHRNSIHFYPDVSWEPGNLDGRARGWWIDEVPRVHVVHPAEVIHVREKHRRADDMFEAEARGFEQCRQIAHHLLGLCRDAAGHELAGRRIDWNLT